MSLLLFALFACASNPSPPAAPSPAHDDDTATHGGEDTAVNGGEDTAVDDGGAEYAAGISQVSVDADTYSDLGYQIQTFSVTADHAQPMVTAEGSEPRFHVLSPPSSEIARPLLILLHGGSMDVETAEAPKGRNSRCRDAHGISYGESYPISHPAAVLGAQQGWVVVVPENSFCDGWTGTGLSEPTDPHHGGFALIKAAVDYLRFGQADVAIDDAHIVVMGHSAGARGATYFAARYPDVSALVFDSGTSDVVRYYYEDEYTSNNLEYLQLCLEHNLGGPPYKDADLSIESPYWDRYRDLGLVQALEADRVPIPIFHVFNSQDDVSPPVQHEDIGPLLRMRDIRHAQLDTNRNLPAHPQISKSWPPALAALQFGLGAHVEFVEGESGTGALGREIQENVYFNGTGRMATPADGAGTLLTLSLDIATTNNVRVVPILYGNRDSKDNAVTVSVQGESSTAAVTLRADQLVPPDASLRDVAAYLDAVTLDVATPQQVEITVTGAAEVAVDTVLLSWMDE